MAMVFPVSALTELIIKWLCTCSLSICVQIHTSKPCLPKFISAHFMPIWCAVCGLTAAVGFYCDVVPLSLGPNVCFTGTEEEL